MVLKLRVATQQLGRHEPTTLSQGAVDSLLGRGNVNILYPTDFTVPTPPPDDRLGRRSLTIFWTGSPFKKIENHCFNLLCDWKNWCLAGIVHCCNIHWLTSRRRCLVGVGVDLDVDQYYEAYSFTRNRVQDYAVTNVIEWIQWSKTIF